MTTNVTVDDEGRPIAWGDANGGTVVEGKKYGPRELPAPPMENAPIRWSESDGRWVPENRD